MTTAGPSIPVFGKPMGRIHVQQPMSRRSGLLGLVAMTVLSVVALSLGLRGQGGVPQTPQPTPDVVRQAYLAAFKSGQDQDIRRLLALLPQAPGGPNDRRFIWEGDLLYSENELIALVGQRIKAWKAKTDFQPLLVVRRDPFDRRDIWALGRRDLAYSIDRESFGPGEADNVMRLMDQAGDDWERSCPSCGVTFRLQQVPGKEPQGSVVFIVRKKNISGELASAFFPSWEPRFRYVNIGERALARGVDTLGIIRHELGHVLGYEHENYQAPAGDPQVRACGVVNARPE